MNQVLLSQKHSGIVKSMQNSSMSMGDFVYGVSSSSPNLSKQIVKLNPNNAIAATVTSQDVVFSLPRNGFCTKAYLVLTLDNADGWNNASWIAPRYVDAMSLRARGIELRRASGTNLIQNAVSHDGSSVDSRMRQIQGLMAKSPATNLGSVQVVVDVGKALGFDSSHESVQNSIDTLFVENCDIHVKLNDMTQVFDIAAAEGSGLGSAQLFCEYVQLSSSDYDAFKSKNYSSSESTRRLCLYGERENPVANTASLAAEVTVPIRYKGLIRKSFIQVWNPVNGVQTQPMGNVTKVELYASGSLLWNCDQAGLLANKLFINPTVFNSGDTENGLKAAGNDNVMGGQEINWALISDNSDKSSFFSGALNTADLTNVELRVTTDNAAGVVDVCHQVMAMQSTDGNSGMLSISSRE